jgi:DNA-binding PadR family transcriptional regulator
MSTATDGGPLHDLTGFQRDLLAAIANQGDSSGLDIKSHLENAYGIQEINHGRLYPNLDTLVDKGLVEKGEQDRRTNYYKLTRRGHRELAGNIEWQRNMLGDDDE